MCCVENKDLRSQEEIEKAIKLGEYIRNGACPVFPSDRHLADMNVL